MFYVLIVSHLDHMALVFENFQKFSDIVNEIFSEIFAVRNFHENVHNFYQRGVAAAGRR